MIVSLESTEYVLTDARGNDFIPTASITYADAFAAFLALNIQLNDSFRYKLYSSSHNKLILWLNENVTGKYYCPVYCFANRQGDVYFELEPDAVLFKIMFS